MGSFMGFESLREDSGGRRCLRIDRVRSNFYRLFAGRVFVRLVVFRKGYEVWR